jgi:hypothetical protein
MFFDEVNIYEATIPEHLQLVMAILMPIFIMLEALLKLVVLAALLYQIFSFINDCREHFTAKYLALSGAGQWLGAGGPLGSEPLGSDGQNEEEDADKGQLRPNRRNGGINSDSQPKRDCGSIQDRESRTWQKGQTAGGGVCHREHRRCWHDEAKHISTRAGPPINQGKRSVMLRGCICYGARSWVSWHWAAQQSMHFGVGVSAGLGTRYSSSPALNQIPCLKPRQVFEDFIIPTYLLLFTTSQLSIKKQGKRTVC